MDTIFLPPLLLALLMLPHLSLEQSARFAMEARRQTRSSNIVRLTCITDPRIDEATQDALFFLNGTTLQQKRISTAPSADGRGVDIIVTREIEGVYSCGLPFDPRTSNNISLVGK